MPPNPYQEIENGSPGTIGWRIHYFDEIGSTQQVAAEMAEAGAAEGTVVIAESQSAGRGRLGRSWHSPPGLNLYSTTILRPPLSPAEIPQLSLVAGIAAAEALAPVAPGLIGLKWPNDIWLKERKAGGIIAEAISDRNQRISCVLLGIGLNLNLPISDLPKELRSTATSVRIATGTRCDRIEVARALFNRLNSRYREIQDRGFAALRSDYEKYFALYGKHVTVNEQGRCTDGIAKGIDNRGALILENESGETKIVAGDVTLEGAYH
jgi:BirA family biotin operon repressor/biotin-[acetyl-CoA-carboxylase] ligase